MTYNWFDLLKFRVRLVFQSKTEHDLHWTKKPTSSWKKYLSCKYHFTLNLLRLPYDIFVFFPKLEKEDIFVLSKLEKEQEKDPYATEEIRRIFDEHR